MSLKTKTTIALAFSVTLAQAQSGTTCSSNAASFGTPSALSYRGFDSMCMQGWSEGGEYSYPGDFSIKNTMVHYECPLSKKRIIMSNGIPDHWVTQGNPTSPCTIPWYVELPLNPTKAAQPTEPPALGIMAMSVNGVPAYGAQEGGGTNAVEPTAGAMITDAQYWWGHAATNGDWHYHSSLVGEATEADENTTLAYAMDGFPIKGPVEDASVLDQCNGRTVNGVYQYHVRRNDQVDGDGEYCDGDSPAIRWNYMVGCYSGDMSRTVVDTCAGKTIPDDCEVVAAHNEEYMVCENDLGAIIGVSSGGAVVLIVVLGLVAWCVRRRQQPPMLPTTNVAEADKQRAALELSAAA